MNTLSDDRRNVQWKAADMVRATLVASAVVLLFGFAYYFQSVIFSLFVGIVLSTALKSPVAWLERRGLKHVTAVAATFFVLTVLLAVALTILIPNVGDQVSGLLTALPEFYDRMRACLAASSNALIREIAGHLPLHSASGMDSGEAAPATFDPISGIIGGLLWGVAVVLFAFYWSLQEQRTLRAIFLLVSAPHRESTRDLIETMQAKVGAFVRGQSLLCLIIGAMTTVAYSLIGLEHAIPLGIVAGLCEAVPTFGPTLGAVPAALVAASQGGGALAGVAVTVAVVHLAENFFLYPRIMDHAVGIHPVVTLLALTGFTALYGVPGAVLAILMAAIIQLLLERFLLSREALDPTPSTGRDSISLLQREAEELMRDVRLSLRNKKESPTDTSDQVEEAVETVARDVEQLLAEDAVPTEPGLKERVPKEPVLVAEASRPEVEK